jgi:hypothetical protein
MMDVSKLASIVAVAKAPSTMMSLDCVKPGTEDSFAMASPYCYLSSANNLESVTPAMKHWTYVVIWARGHHYFP